MTTTSREPIDSPIEAFGSGWNRFWFTPADPLPLSVLRVFVGLAALYYLGSHTSDLVRWFGPAGLAPVEMVERLTEAGNFHISYFYLFDDPAALWTAHVIGLIIVALFTAGAATPMTAVLALVVVLSYMHRAPMLTGQFEPVLAFMMVYLCIGPANRHFSLDRRLGWFQGNNPADAKRGAAIPPPAESWRANLSLRLMQVHLVGIYLLMGLSQLGGLAWWRGEAVWWIMAQSESRLVDLTWLRDLPQNAGVYLINLWTHAIVVFELAFAVFIWYRVTRPMLLVISLVMWSGVALISGLAAFSLMMLIASICFVSPETLRRMLPGTEPALAPAAAKTA